MPNKSQAVDAKAEVVPPTGGPPIPQDYGPTVSAIAAIFSVLAIIISLWTAVYSRRSDRRSLFDSDFGTPLRAALRDLEKSVDDLSAFIFESAKSLDQLQDELQETQSKIEERTLGCSRLIREIDTSTTVKCCDWEKRFGQRAEAARIQLDALYSPNIVNRADFQKRADLAREAYRALVAESRTKIDDIRRSNLKNRIRSVP